MVLYTDLKFDRAIDVNKHYISPGGYHITTKNGEEIGFDFVSYEGFVDNNDCSILHVVQSIPDYDAFPEMKDLDAVLKHGHYSFDEFFVYTGEYDDEPINLKEVIGVVFSLDDGDEIDLSDRLPEINRQIHIEV